MISRSRMISVVIPNYNSAKYLAKTVQSVQSQTLTHWELLIVDDGSQDNSLEIAEEFSREDSRISVYSQPNAGASAARNHGLRESNPDYPFALCLDSDDLLLPDALQSLLALLDLNPHVPAACGSLRDMDDEGRLTGDSSRPQALHARRGVEGLRLVRRKPNAPLVFGDLCLSNYITTPGQVLMRKTALAVVGSFNTSLVYVEDYDLWWRLTMQLGPIPMTSKPVLLYRHHNASISRNKTAVRTGAAAFRWRLLTHSDMTPVQRRTARLGYFYRSWAGVEAGLHYVRNGEIKHGFKHAALGVRELILFTRDMARARNLPAA